MAKKGVSVDDSESCDLIFEKEQVPHLNCPWRTHMTICSNLIEQNFSSFSNTLPPMLY